MKKIVSILLAVLMLTGILGITAGAEGLKEAAIVVGTLNGQGKYAHLEVIVVEGGGAKYVITDEDGVAYTSGATEENYNVKLEYKDGMATVYLRNANLINDRNHGLEIGRSASGNKAAIAGFPCTIVVESDSYIESRKYEDNGKAGSYQGIAFSNRADNIITGPGKLTVKSLRVYAINGGSGNLTFKDVTVDMSNNYDTGLSTRPTLWMQAGDLVFDNAKITAVNGRGPTLWISENNSEQVGENLGDIIIKNGSKMHLTNQVSSLPGIGTAGGEFKIDNSDVTIISQSIPFKPKPVMTGVGAVAGTKESNAKPYSDKKLSTYTYFHCGPDVKAEEETTPPTTQQQVPPTTQQQVPPTTQAAPSATQQQVPPTTQQQVPPTTNAAPSVNEPTGNNTGSSTLVTVLVIILCVVAFLVIGAAAAVIIIKKKNGTL